jgi:hypothetical protein
VHILIGIAIAVALLCFWLTGQWFARVLMFLLLAAVLGFYGSQWGQPRACPNLTLDEALIDASRCVRPAGADFSIPAGLIGIALAWPLAGIPAYCRRRRPGPPYPPLRQR